jgi:hypothetical protein
MTKLATVQDIDIYDPSSLDWSTFAWDNGYHMHKLSEQEILRPYLVSYTYFGTVGYEEILLLLNSIDDVWTLVPGAEIRIPKLADIRTFIIKNKK